MKFIGIVACCLLVCDYVYAQEYKIEVFIPGHGFHGIHGITFDAYDQILVGSVVGQAIYQLNPLTGESFVKEQPLLGMADDLEYGPDGALYWTSIVLGKLHKRNGVGPIEELATGLPGMNALAFKQDGRLFATQVFMGDALHEIDPTGQKRPRKIMENMGGLNGFDFGPDGLLYGPLWFKGQVVKIDVDTAEMTVLAKGFKVPAAANFNSKGELFILDSGRGQIVQLNPRTGDKIKTIQFKTAMDNLAFNSRDEMFVTVMSENAIYKIDIESGDAHKIKESALAFPADLAIFENTLYLSDTFAMRSIDLETGKITDQARMAEHEFEYSNGIGVSEKFVHQTSYFNNAVQTLDRKTGEILRTYHDVVTPFDVVEWDDGSLLVLQMATGTLSRFRSDTDRTVIAKGLTGPVGLVRADADSVYVTEYGQGRIQKIDIRDGSIQLVVKDLNGPEGIAVDQNGFIYVAEVLGQQVSRINPVDGFKTVIADNLPIGFKLPPGMPPMGSTTGIAIAANGDVYLSSDQQDAIYRLRKAQ